MDGNGLEATGAEEALRDDGRLPGAQPGRWRERAIAAALFVVLAASSLAPIWASDYFWHLAAGRWMVEHRAIPLSDPLTVASAKTPWINGEWLFEVVLYGVYELVGHDGIALLRAGLVAALFTWLYVRLLATGSRLLALTVAFAAWYGALPWLRERPSATGAFFALLMVVVLGARSPRWRAAGVFLLGVVWINVHPSALLAPAIVGGERLGAMLEERDASRKRVAELVLLVLLAGLSLLINPWGLDGVLNPLHVTSIAQLEVLSNEEWGPSRLGEFRYFAVALAAVAAAALTSARRRGWVSSLLLLAGFVALALKYARSQTIFFVAAPLLLVPHLKPPREAIARLLAIPLAITALTVVAMSPFRGGIDMEKFPVAATVRVQVAQLRGNILCSYGLGGFLTWSFGRERRVLNDGRAELHMDYLHRWQEARTSASSLRRFLDDYAVGLAWVGMDEGPVFVRDASGATQPVRQWEAFYPPAEWALVAADDAAAVFARRSMNDPAAIARVELPRQLLPPVPRP